MSGSEPLVYHEVSVVPKCRVLTIEFVVEVETSFGEEEGLDYLRGYGAAEVVKEIFITNTLDEASEILRARASA